MADGRLHNSITNFIQILYTNYFQFFFTIIYIQSIIKKSHLMWNDGGHYSTWKGWVNMRVSEGDGEVELRAIELDWKAVARLQPCWANRFRIEAWGRAWSVNLGTGKRCRKKSIPIGKLKVHKSRKCTLLLLPSSIIFVCLGCTSSKLRNQHWSHFPCHPHTPACKYLNSCIVDLWHCSLCSSSTRHPLHLLVQNTILVPSALLACNRAFILATHSSYISIHTWKYSCYLILITN